MLSKIEKVIYLKKVPIFQNLTGEELMILSEITSEEQFDDGEVVFHENTYGYKLFIIKEGSVDIFKCNEKQPVAKLSVSDCFGEMSLFDDSSHSATVRAVGRLECIVIPKEGFLDILNEYPSIAVEMLKVLAKRLRDATDRLAACSVT